MNVLENKYGNYKAKISINSDELPKRDSKLILVTSINSKFIVL